jgi:hypothetical protein
MLGVDNRNDQNEEAREQRLADAAYALCWEAKCDGFKYLGFYEMQQHKRFVIARVGLIINS